MTASSFSTRNLTRRPPSSARTGAKIFITSMRPTVSPAATASPSDLKGGLSGAGARKKTRGSGLGNALIAISPPPSGRLAEIVGERAGLMLARDDEGPVPGIVEIAADDQRPDDRPRGGE